MNETVAIIGGGVAGLSAAHELIKRGFRVHVYERRAYFGGKAASYRISGSAAKPATKDDPPGEHGFRFFPGWYRHLFSTLQDIPYQDRQTLYRGATVADNLVQVRTNRLTWLGRPPIDLPLQIPRNASEAVNATQFVAAFRELGLSAGEVTLFFRKLLEVATMSEADRVDQLEKISWWEFLECDDVARSQAYRDFIRATTQTMVAAKAKEASAYTIGRVAVRTFLDTFTSVDRVLNGPTHEVWIDPWVEHLTAQGVVFHSGMELDSIQFDPDNKAVRQMVVEPVAVANMRRLRALMARVGKDPAGLTKDDLDDMLSLVDDVQQGGRLNGEPATEARARRDALSDARATVKQARNELAMARARLQENEVALANGRQPGRNSQLERQVLAENVRQDREAVGKIWSAISAAVKGMTELSHQLGRAEARASRVAPVAADYFVLALPLEQLAYHVNRSPMLRFLAPELQSVQLLARHMDWMAGIQFYLNRPVAFSPGHLVGMDSPWALTAIESTQFWKNVDLPRSLRSVLSVDISAWDKAGLLTRKEAFNCTNQEIAEDVWAQLEQMLNRQDRPAVLGRDMLVGGELTSNVSYHLDESIVDLRDRKKQAFYERARSIRFNTLDFVDQSGESDPTSQDRYMWGPRPRFNVEPLLVNRPGSHALRPEAQTGIVNLFLAGDYVKTETDLASMEGANEAARRAVNCVLSLSGSRAARCELYPFSPVGQVLGTVGEMTQIVKNVRHAAAGAAALQDRFWKPLALGMFRAKSDRQI